MKVKNIKTGGLVNGIYIGRRNNKFPQSPLANPFFLRGEEEREIITQGYHWWLYYKIHGQSRHQDIANELGIIITKNWTDPSSEEVLAELKLIHDHDSDVYCYCHPQKCHGDIVILIINQMFRSNTI